MSGHHYGLRVLKILFIVVIQGTSTLPVNQHSPFVNVNSDSTGINTLSGIFSYGSFLIHLEGCQFLGKKHKTSDQRLLTKIIGLENIRE